MSTAPEQHPLAQYLADAGLTQADLARASGVHRGLIAKVLGGKRERFSAEAAFAIERATRGAVRFEDLWKPSKKHNAPKD